MATQLIEVLEAESSLDAVKVLQSSRLLIGAQCNI